MNNTDIHEQLTNHLSHLAMGFPNRKGLLEILKASYSKEEAKIALVIPSKKIPFKGITAKEISKSVKIPLEQLDAIKIELRKDLEGKIPEESFKALQEKILKTRP